jgi:NitT/TauT family transport system substrate-binding protein
MHKRHAAGWNRREFLERLALAGAAGLLGLRPELVAAEPPPETTTFRLVQIPSICQVPQYVAEELLRSEGFTTVQYVKKEGTEGIEEALASGEADLNGHFAAPLIITTGSGRSHRHPGGAPCGLF